MGHTAHRGSRPREEALGRLLFDRYPHLVPSPTWVFSLARLLGEGAQGVALEGVQPMRVLEAWFDCWAALALREAPDACPCATPL